MPLRSVSAPLTGAGRQQERGPQVGVLISNDAGVDALLQEDEVAQVVEVTLALEGVERPCEVSVSFVDVDEMRALNAEWRHIDTPTDVLSFECDSPFDEGLPADETVELGDVMLAPDVIAGQASEFGQTPVEECRLMLVHGLLHLLGYDHIAEDEALLMEGREEAILRELAIRRGDDPDTVRIGPTTRHVAD